MRGRAAGRGRCALDMAEGTSGVGPAGGADQATAATPEALEPGAYDRAGGRWCAIRPLHGEAWHRADAPWREGEQALVDPEIMRIAWGTDKLGPQSPGDLSGHRKNATEWGLLTS